MYLDASSNFIVFLMGLLVILIKLELSTSFKNVPNLFASFKKPSISFYLSNDAELFREGLKLWNDHYVSIKEWESKLKESVESEESYSDVLKIKNVLNYGKFVKIKNLIENDSQILKNYPMIPDLIVEKVSVTDNEEIETLVDFFLKAKLYRQLAALVALHEPKIVADHFKEPSFTDLKRFLEFLFKLKPERIREFFKDFGADKLFLLAPLVACSKQNSEIVRKIIMKLAANFRVSRVQLVLQVCIGIMLTDYRRNRQRIYTRNDDLIQFIEKDLMYNPSKTLSAAIKACHVMNLIKFDYRNVHRIRLEIATVEDTEMLFTILLKVAAKSNSNHYKTIIESLRI